MTTISLRPLHHRGQESIAIHFSYDKDLVALIRRLPDVRWTTTHKCWYIPLTKKHYRLLLKSLQPFSATLDNTAVKGYLQQRKALLHRPTIGSNALVVQPVLRAKHAHVLQNSRLCAENLHALQLYLDQLHLKAYSSSTIRTYRSEFLSLLQLLKGRDVATLTTEELRRYLLYCMERKD